MSDNFAEMTIRNLMLRQRLQNYWRERSGMFERDCGDLYIGLIPQLFNIKVVVGKLSEKGVFYDDGY